MILHGGRSWRERSVDGWWLLVVVVAALVESDNDGHGGGRAFSGGGRVMMMVMELAVTANILFYHSALQGLFGRSPCQPSEHVFRTTYTHFKDSHDKGSSSRDALSLPRFASRNHAVGVGSNY